MRIHQGMRHLREADPRTAAALTLNIYASAFEQQEELFSDTLGFGIAGLAA
jgi:hypothetical protein